MTWPAHADLWVVEQVQRLHDGPLDAVAKLLSTLGFRLALLVLGVLVVSPQRRLQAAVATVAAVLLTIGVSDLVKGAIGRPRPSLASDSVHPLVPVPGTGSFPSTHASTAFAVAVVVAAFAPRFRGLAFVLATLIALSRVWLGVHYPTDVIGGAAIGALLGGLVVELSRRWWPVRAPDAPDAAA